MCEARRGKGQALTIHPDCEEELAVPRVNPGHGPGAHLIPRESGSSGIPPG